MTNPKMFHHILQLENENIISVEEYLVGRWLKCTCVYSNFYIRITLGKPIEQEKLIFLFVMPYLNKSMLSSRYICMIISYLTSIYIYRNSGNFQG